MKDGRDNSARFGPESGMPAARRQVDPVRAGHLSRHSVTVVLAVAVVLVLLGTVAYASVLPSRGTAARGLRLHSGVRIGDSRGSGPIVSMRGMVPGDHVRGVVRIRNKGRVSARFSLGVARLKEARGAGGGRLSRRLVLTVKLLRRHHRARLVYRGPLWKLRRAKLGVFRPGERRTYRFRVVFPSRGANSDNRLMGASARLSFRWSAHAVRQVRAP